MNERLTRDSFKLNEDQCKRIYQIQYKFTELLGENTSGLERGMEFNTVCCALAIIVNNTMDTYNVKSMRTEFLRQFTDLADQLKALFNGNCNSYMEFTNGKKTSEGEIQ